ncbi:SURF1 family protein [Agrobacterium sp. O3.4]|uniref:SURF1-like protein n=1 Tax=Agrobacterium cucumeris TaxID=2862866 RepID=A0ABY8RR25_9HYPH|nr:MULTISPECIES: SURF1 family protein [Rhizobium/Agrobacterium group]MCZ7468193.1 SURF1 family protein [Rhizobium rhizogenes]WHO09584.1 SURF1 family protein [Agrobacterium cucumeris]
MKAADRRVWFAAPLVLLALAILLGLGTWQVKRLYWKEALMADIEERLSASPVPLADIEAMAKSGGDIEYRKVRLSGAFDHGRERHFFATHQGRTGYYIYTPLTLADGRILFVNRGFVPFEMKEQAKRAEGQVTGEVVITGLARAPLIAKPSSLLPDNDIAKNIFYWKDLAVMASSVDIPSNRLVNLFVDADNAQNPGGWPQGGVTLIDLPNNHLQYAITWYGLALALVIVVGFAYFRNHKARDE